jgi:uncharacterized protein VirK/YbjX
LLYAALQGIAKALHQQFIIGLCAESSLSFDSDEDNYYGAYNAFWEKLGGNRISKSYFELPVVQPAKQFSDVSARHRKRSIGRHELKKNIADQVEKTISTYLVNPN